MSAIEVYSRALVITIGIVGVAAPASFSTVIANAFAIVSGGRDGGRCGPGAIELLPVLLVDCAESHEDVVGRALPVRRGQE